MKVMIAATGETLDHTVCEQFGRCPFFLLVDTETQATQVRANPGALANSGAGIAAANEVAASGATAVIAGQFGPKAEQALRAANIRMIAARGTIADALAQRV